MEHRYLPVRCLNQMLRLPYLPPAPNPLPPQGPGNQGPTRRGSPGEQCSCTASSSKYKSRCTSTGLHFHSTTSVLAARDYSCCACAMSCQQVGFAAAVSGTSLSSLGFIPLAGLDTIVSLPSKSVWPHALLPRCKGMQAGSRRPCARSRRGWCPLCYAHCRRPLLTHALSASLPPRTSPRLASEYNLDALKSGLSAGMSPKHAAMQSLSNPGDDFATLVRSHNVQYQRSSCPGKQCKLAGPGRGWVRWGGWRSTSTQPNEIPQSKPCIN